MLTAVLGPCTYKASDVAAHITGWRWATSKKNESEMATHLVAWSPLTIAVDASSWMDYSGGGCLLGVEFSCHRLFVL